MQTTQKIRKTQRMSNWLETHWVDPSFSGWLLIGLAIFFFIAGTNTLSGWLYVISGVILALLAIAVILSRRTLRHIQLQRGPIHPISAGDHLTIEVMIENRSRQPKALLEVQDLLPAQLGEPATKSIEVIPPQQTHHWIYCCPTQKRGVYRWQSVQVRTANPLGLFWYRRDLNAKTSAIVYPMVLPLTHCPLIDQMGQDASLLFNSDRRAQAATEGLTRSLRPYRWGDPTRLIHWRSSAKHNEFRVRELEVFTGGQELVIALDSGFFWQIDTENDPTNDFEQAVIAAVSLYFYAGRHNFNVKLWTAGTGLIQGNQVVLEALAATQSGEAIHAQSLPSVPLIWLTQNPSSLDTLPVGSRWLLWQQETGAKSGESLQVSRKGHTSNLHPRHVGIVITRQETLQEQLQRVPNQG